tara:strand:+ start:366 stop:587 length:222 start_codon:yes stop_codon:yes gene_type:complete
MANNINGADKTSGWKFAILTRKIIGVKHIAMNRHSSNLADIFLFENNIFDKTGKEANAIDCRAIRVKPEGNIL